MRRLLAFLTIAGMLTTLTSYAQTPPVIEGRVYVVTYVEVLPTAVKDTAPVLKQYREASRKDGSPLRMEVVEEIARPARFVILTIWPDQKAFDAYGKGAQTAAFREKLKTIQAAPYDERVLVKLTDFGIA